MTSDHPNLTIGNARPAMRAAVRGIGKTLLILAFYCLFMPAGFLMRLLFGDPLHRKIDASAESYYQPSKPRGKNHMDRPY